MFECVERRMTVASIFEVIGTYRLAGTSPQSL